jgi:hypothetical protein
MAVKVKAVIKKVPFLDQRTGAHAFCATLSLLSEAGKEYGPERALSGFEELADLFKREAGTSYEALQDRYVRYQQGEAVELYLSLDSDETIRKLGFDPTAAREP